MIMRIQLVNFLEIFSRSLVTEDQGEEDTEKTHSMRIKSPNSSASASNSVCAPRETR